MRWLKSYGLIFLPVPFTGWIVTNLAAAFCLHIFLVVDGRSHSATGTLYGLFPYRVPTFLLWTWIARRTSEESKRSF